MILCMYETTSLSVFLGLLLLLLSLLSIYVWVWFFIVRWCIFEVNWVHNCCMYVFICSCSSLEAEFFSVRYLVNYDVFMYLYMCVVSSFFRSPPPSASSRRLLIVYMQKPLSISSINCCTYWTSTCSGSRIHQINKKNK